VLVVNGNCYMFYYYGLTLREPQHTDFRTGLGFCHGSGKTTKTGNKFSTLNWIEILWCNYNAPLNH